MNREKETHMSKITSLIRRAPKRLTAIVAMIAAAVIVPAVVFAWGPSRDTFTMASPAPYVTFNSITDNPQVGDERNFVRIKEAGTNTYVDQVALQPGKTYTVSLFYHNNAKTSLNESGAGVALNAKARIQMPGVVQAGETATITGFVNASNSNPLSVWDEARGTNGSGAIALRYVQGSAKFVSNGAINGQTVPDSLFTTGANLGFDSQNGTVPGCNEFAGFINFNFVVDQPNFEVKKEVSTDNKTWKKSVASTAGSTVYYRVSYKNTGTTQQDGVTVRDYLPNGISYVNGSTVIANSVTNGQYQATSNGITVGNGLNVGSYAPNGDVYLKFSGKVADEAALACGVNSLKNVVRFSTSGGYKEDDATVTVNKTCEPGKISVCELATKKIITINESAFDASKHTKDLSKCSELPPELPKTGVTENIVAVLGLGALIASIAYYVASRRALV